MSQRVNNSLHILADVQIFLENFFFKPTWVISATGRVSVDIKQSDTIATLKNKIAEKLYKDGSDGRHIRLFLYGRSLKDEKNTVRKEGIRECSTLEYFYAK